ncbi:MAG: hypothetical protein PHT40_03405 [Patescibacteria group bacterium]|nr:hypothetical protein [Patescibacteria group bacterium]
MVRSILENGFGLAQKSEKNNKRERGKVEVFFELKKKNLASGIYETTGKFCRASSELQESYAHQAFCEAGYLGENSADYILEPVEDEGIIKKLHLTTPQRTMSYPWGVGKNKKDLDEPLATLKFEIYDLAIESAAAERK